MVEDTIMSDTDTKNQMTDVEQSELNNNVTAGIIVGIRPENQTVAMEQSSISSGANVDHIDMETADNMDTLVKRTSTHHERPVERGTDERTEQSPMAAMATVEGVAHEQAVTPADVLISSRTEEPSSDLVFDMRNMIDDVRLMIWKCLLPKRQPIVMARIDPSPTPHLRFTPQPEYGLPIISQICQESRHVLYGTGGPLTFGAPGLQGPQRRCLWWYSKTDVLIFHSWDLRGDELLQGVEGLEHVRHVALTTNQGLNLGYELVYRRNDGAQLKDHIPERDRPLPLAIRLRFQAKKQQHQIYRHFVTQMFPGLKRITVLFSELCSVSDTRRWLQSVQPDGSRRGREDFLVTFEVDEMMTLEDAIGALKKFKELVQRARIQRPTLTGPTPALGFDKTGEYLSGPFLAVRDDFVLKDKYIRDDGFFTAVVRPCHIIGTRTGHRLAL